MMNTILKFFFTATVIAAAVACANGTQTKDETAPPEINVAFGNPAPDGTALTWKAGDDVWLSDGSSSVIVVVTNAYDGKSFFSFPKPSELSGDILYAVSPASAAVCISDGKIRFRIPDEQDGTLPDANIFTAVSESTNLSLRTAVSFIRFAEIADGVKHVAVSAAGLSGVYEAGPEGVLGPVDGETMNVVTFTPASGQCYIATAPVALPEGVSVRCEDASWTVTGYETLASGKDLESGRILELGNVKPNGKVPEGTINHAFSVSPSKKVHFSKGNLKVSTEDGWKTATWAFYDRQFESSMKDWSSPDDKVIDQFTWSYNPAFSTDPVTNLYDECFMDYGIAFGSSSPWRTLSKEEWAYLTKGRGVGDKFAKADVEVCGRKNCLVIAPDGNESPIRESYDTVSWADAEAAGMVCLPSSGYRDGPGGNCKCEYGIYWSSTPYGRYLGYSLFFYTDEQSFEYNGFRVTKAFPEDRINPAYGGLRYRGYFVRLVTD